MTPEQEMADLVTLRTNQLIQYNILVPANPDGEMSFVDEKMYMINEEFQSLISSFHCGNPSKAIRLALEVWISDGKGLQEGSEFDMDQISLIIQQMFHLIACKGME